MNFRMIYPKFKKFLEGHEDLRQLCKDHLVGDYTMPPSLALPIIASLTPPDTVELKITDDNIGQSIDYEEETDLVVISCFTPQAQRAYEIADEFRKRGTKVILGGIHPTGRPKEALLHADAVCVGEVENIWLDIIDDLKKNKLKSIYKSETPFPLCDMTVPKREIFSRDIYKWDAHLIITTRGCPVGCEGCPIPHKEDVRLRYRPVDKVIADIASMPYREFYFVDDTIMLPSKKAKKYLLQIMERTVDMDVSIFLASTMMMYPDPEFYKQLKKGGATSMYTVFGFDKASRALFDKNCSRELWQKNVDLVKMNEDAGIHFFASYGMGFDNHDKGVFERILKFSDDANIDLAEFFIHTPFPGTPFGRQCEKEERILHRNYHYWNTGNVVFRPAQMTEDELLEGFKMCWSEFYKNKKPANTIRSFEVEENKKGKDELQYCL